MSRCVAIRKAGSPTTITTAIAICRSISSPREWKEEALPCRSRPTGGRLSKTGTDHDATAVTFFALDNLSRRAPLLILDWDIAQIEGALLETWLPMVFDRLEELSRLCGGRHGSVGVWIEDKNSGTILLQQAIRRQWPATAIDSKLTAVSQAESRQRQWIAGLARVSGSF
jgi:hypothetical protein